METQSKPIEKKPRKLKTKGNPLQTNAKENKGEPTKGYKKAKRNTGNQMDPSESQRSTIGANPKRKDNGDQWKPK